MRPATDLALVIIGSFFICFLSELIFGKEMLGGFFALLGSMYLGLNAKKLLDLYFNEKTSDQEKQDKDN